MSYLCYSLALSIRVLKTLHLLSRSYFILAKTSSSYKSLFNSLRRTFVPWRLFASIQVPPVAYSPLNACPIHLPHKLTPFLAASVPFNICAKQWGIASNPAQQTRTPALSARRASTCTSSASISSPHSKNSGQDPRHFSAERTRGDTSG